MRRNRQAAPVSAVDDNVNGLPFGHGGNAGWDAAGLTLAERITGVRLPADFLGRDMPAVILDEGPPDLIPDGAEDHAALQDAVIQQAIAEPTVESIPAIAAGLARLIASDAGLLDEPAVSEVLDVLDVGGTPRPESRVRLTELGDRYVQASRTGPGSTRANLFRQGHAIVDFIAAAFPNRDPLSRFTTGGYVFRDADKDLQASVLRQVAYQAVREAKASSLRRRPHS